MTLFATSFGTISLRLVHWVIVFAPVGPLFTMRA